MTVPAPELAAVRVAVGALLAEFSCRIDGGETVGDLFDESAIFVTPRGEIRGRDAIVGLFASVHSSRQAEAHVSRHGCLNVHVTAIGANRFEVRSLIMGFASIQPTSTGALLIGDQIDIVELGQDGIYRFTRREMSPVIEYILTPKIKATS